MFERGSSKLLSFTSGPWLNKTLRKMLKKSFFGSFFCLQSKAIFMVHTENTASIIIGTTRSSGMCHILHHAAWMGGKLGMSK